MKRAALLVSVSLYFLSGCVSTKSVEELKQIQDTEGFFSKSLFYTGSTKSFHYFDQYKLWDRGWMLSIVPGIETDGYDPFKVARSQIILPQELEFPRQSYEGEHDERRAKIRIKEQPNFRAERRKTGAERLAEKNIDDVDLSKVRFKKIDDNTYEAVFE